MFMAANSCILFCLKDYMHNEITEGYFMKPKKTGRLIPIESILKKDKWNEYCRLANISAVVRNSIKNHPEHYDGVCLLVAEDIADKLGFIWKI
jgi:hypothetical protein